MLIGYCFTSLVGSLLLLSQIHHRFKLRTLGSRGSAAGVRSWRRDTASSDRTHRVSHRGLCAPRLANTTRTSAAACWISSSDNEDTPDDPLKRLSGLASASRSLAPWVARCAGRWKCKTILVGGPSRSRYCGNRHRLLATAPLRRPTTFPSAGVDFNKPDADRAWCRPKRRVVGSAKPLCRSRPPAGVGTAPSPKTLSKF